MSQEYDNDLRGVLFKNDRKERDQHPDYKGSCEIEGVEYWIAAWINDGKKGKFMSLSFTEKDGQAPDNRPQNPPAREPVRQTRSQQRGSYEDSRGRTEARDDGRGRSEYDDDIPF